MKDSCDIISAFCSDAAKEKLLHIYNNLEKQGLIPHGVEFKQNGFDVENNNLFFISFNKNIERSLQSLMNKTDFKKCQIIIVSDDEENFFNFAMEYNICNIVHINNLSEILLRGILKRFLTENSSLEVFFDEKTNVFDKRYYISGNICMQNFIENTFGDFIDKLKNTVKTTFIINCHELVTNAIAYGVLGISAQVRDRKASDIGRYINIPEEKKVEIHLLMNEEFYGISAMDFSGTLTVNRILERIRRQSIVAGETIPQGIEDHTGRGLAILSHHGLLIFSIKPGKFTTVSLISQVKESFKRGPLSILATEL